jgi:multidrug resistance efflux pump
MPTLEPRKITIRLPALSWQSILNRRVAIAVILCCLAGSFFYWLQVVRPYFWTTTAHVEAFSAPIYANVSGKITEMGPAEGEVVQAGTLLFSLDREQILNKQKNTQSFIHSLKEEVAKEQLRMEETMQNYILASADMESGMNDAEHHLTFFEEAQGNSERALEQIKSLEEEVRFLNEQMKKTQFIAPFDGIVLKRAKQTEMHVSSGEPVYFLLNPKQMWIDAEVAEDQIGHLKLGTSAKIRVLAYPKKEWTGKVSWIAPATVAKTSDRPFAAGKKETVAIRVSLDDPNFSLKPGLSAEVGLKIR